MKKNPFISFNDFLKKLKGIHNNIKQYKVVKKGVPDMTISDFDCKKHAETLGNTNYRFFLIIYELLCIWLDQVCDQDLLELKEYYFNNIFY